MRSFVIEVKLDPVSVLFCDVVAFSSIVARCKANDVVNLLTQLHTKFNKICGVHDTFRVCLSVHLSSAWADKVIKTRHCVSKPPT